jgi:hypothetical protein
MRVAGFEELGKKIWLRSFVSISIHEKPVFNLDVLRQGGYLALRL